MKKLFSCVMINGGRSTEILDEVNRLSEVYG